MDISLAAEWAVPEERVVDSGAGVLRGR